MGVQFLSRRPAWLALLVIPVLVVGTAVAVPRHDLASAYRRFFPDPDHIYRAEVLQQARRSRQIHGAVVFLGDSETVGLATSEVVDRSENFGIAGDTVDKLTARVRTYDLSGAGQIVLQIGINNWPADAFEGFRKKYRSTLAALPPQVPVVAVAIFPLGRRASESVNLEGALDGIRTANRAIRAECGARPGCRYIDLTPVLSGPDGFLRDDLVEADGVHLSATGYAIWAHALRPLLAP